ncbi:chaperone protein dnaJ 20, chloroplastic-like [Aristolochia californica]|uniref:chaperone protein dnaJ 20, chloroplastic-like n=1 Tax=Aristolochia californica TaxID=171875 RepID=UPI0035DBC99A
MSCRLISDGISNNPLHFFSQETNLPTNSTRSLIVSFGTHLQKPTLKASPLLLPSRAAERASVSTRRFSVFLHGCAHLSSRSGFSPVSSISNGSFSLVFDVRVFTLKSDAFHKNLMPNASTFFNYPPPQSAKFKTFSIRGDEFTDLSSDASFYELLGISENVSFSEIKQAYKQMALKYHPDVSPPDRTEEYTKRFIRLQQAYETLSDARKREIYDRDLARGLHCAFSVRKQFDQQLEEKTAWRNRWQDQVAGLKWRSRRKASEVNMSWGARMRRMRKQSFEE